MQNCHKQYLSISYKILNNLSNVHEIFTKQSSAKFWNGNSHILFIATICARSSSDATILVFGIRYDIDTILPKYRDIDTISIFYEERLRKMDLPSLPYRRRRRDAIEVYVSAWYLGLQG